jgi:hypothetical protein
MLSCGLNARGEERSCALMEIGKGCDRSGTWSVSSIYIQYCLSVDNIHDGGG